MFTFTTSRPLIGSLDAMPDVPIYHIQDRLCFIQHPEIYNASSGMLI